MIIVIPMNAEEDGSCKTIKATIQQSSLANFVRGGAWGATGVMVIEQDEDNTSNEHLR